MSTEIKHITANIKVWAKYAQEIADNGRRGDDRQILMIGPDASGQNEEWVYLETNGDPVLVGWVDDDTPSGYAASNEFAPHLDNPECHWIVEALGWSASPPQA
jgi:hypothetical protein